LTRTLEVLLHGQPVGQLSELSESGSELRFHEDYFDRVRRPVLGQKFEDDLRRVHRSRRGQDLPDFFANLVPEGRLREVIEKSAGIEPGDTMSLLAFVGRDLPGAVEVRPLGDELAPETWNETIEQPPTPDPSESDKNALRFSLAGVQLKFSMLRDDERLTLPIGGASGRWIVKFDSPSFPNLPENELSMLLWAREAGFDVPECHLHPVSAVDGLPRGLVPPDTQILAVRRYDRSADGEERIHQEDFAQAVELPPTRKYDVITYEVLAQLAGRFIDQTDAVDEFVRRLVLVIATGNNDAHLKNWSMIYPDRIQARWSPLYDQVATIAWPAPDRALSLKLADVKQFGQIDRAAFERLATKASLGAEHVLSIVDQTLAELRRAWHAVRADLPLPKAHADAIRDHWRSVPLLREAGDLS